MGVDDVHVGGDVGVAAVVEPQRADRNGGDVGLVGEESAWQLGELVEAYDVAQRVEAVGDRR